jgi:hypothetical protein
LAASSGISLLNKSAIGHATIRAKRKTSSDLVRVETRTLENPETGAENELCRDMMRHEKESDVTRVQIQIMGIFYTYRCLELHRRCEWTAL